MSAAAETAKIEMEAARGDIVDCEREIQAIKTALRPLQTSSDEEPPNSLEIAVLKVEGLPNTAKPTFAVQLSSPVEEHVLDKLHDPLAPTENLAVFESVETSMATLTLSVKDADVDLGVSAPYDVAPLCTFDVMSPKPQYVTELAIAVAAEGSTAAVEETKDDSGEAKEGEEAAEAKHLVAQPTCTVTLRVTYKPSAKDKKEELYDLLNKASQKKAKAIERLRRSATAVSRAAPHQTGAGAGEVTPASKTRQPAVQAGFLNKKSKKKQSKFMQWYGRMLGPQSYLRDTMIPVGKNYVIFFVAVTLFHFKGQELALPAPV